MSELANIKLEVSITIDDHSAEVLAAVNNALVRGLEAIGMAAETHATEYITQQGAVDTGRLRNSITHAVNNDELEVIVGTNVEYAPYIELGTGIYAESGEGRQTPWSWQDDEGNWHTTRGMKPRPYLRPALNNHISEYENLIKDSLENA